MSFFEFAAKGPGHDKFEVGDYGKTAKPATINCGKSIHTSDKFLADSYFAVGHPSDLKARSRCISTCISAWLEACCKNHQRCRQANVPFMQENKHSSKKGTLPTSLIALENKNGPVSARLIEMSTLNTKGGVGANFLGKTAGYLLYCP